MRKKYGFYIKIVLILLLILAFGLLFGGKLAHSASPSDGGVYNPYDEFEGDFDYGFDDCNDCDFDDDDDNNDDEPDVSTRVATSISDTNATLQGRVDGNGSSTRIWFEYGDNRDLDENTSKRSVGSNTTSFNIRVSGLRANTTYYFRAVAENNDGIDYGNTLSFRTDRNGNGDDNDNESAPSTRTDGATSISDNTAQLNAFVRESNDNSIDVWFEWGRSISLGNETNRVRIDASPSATHRATITGLNPGTTYYFRAVAENDDWRNNGAILSFRTTGGAVIIQNPPVITSPTTGGTIKETPTTNDTPKDETEVEGVKSSLEANVLGFSFFPTTLLGWLAFIVLVLTLYILGRKHLYPPAHQPVVIDTHGHH